jgi:LacI family transcriptional regulator
MLRQTGRQDADRVGADFRLGMTLAAEHVIRLGHKRIAFVGGGRRVSPVRDRAEGFRETLTRHGLAVGPIVDCMPTRQDGAKAVDRLFQGGPGEPTAILCHNDLCALGVMVGLADRGLAPGRDVAVVGFDNIPESAMHRPALTTVAIEPRRIGEEAADLLLRRVKEPGGAPETIIDCHRGHLRDPSHCASD